MDTSLIRLPLQDQVPNHEESLLNVLVVVPAQNSEVFCRTYTGIEPLLFYTIHFLLPYFIGLVFVEILYPC